MISTESVDGKVRNFVGCDGHLCAEHTYCSGDVLQMILELYHFGWGIWMAPGMWTVYCPKHNQERIKEFNRCVEKPTE